MFQRNPGPSFVRRRRIIASVLAVVFALGFLGVLTTTAAEQNVSDPAFYKSALEGQDAYGRAYDSILFDPELTAQVQDLLGGVQIPRREIKKVVKEIAPPEKLRQAVEDAIDRVIEFMLTGDDLVLALDVTSFIEAITEAVVDFTIQAVSALPEERSPSYEAFVGQFVTTLDTLDRGGIPTSIPSYPIPDKDVPVIAGVVFEVGKIDPQSELGRAVYNAVQQDDVAGAIKVATASILVDLITRSVEALTAEMDSGPRGEILLAAPASVVDQLKGRLELPRTVLDIAPVGRTVAAAIALAALAAICALYAADWRHALRWIGATVLATGLATFAFWGIARSLLVSSIGDVVVKKAPDFPQSFSTLVDDVLRSAVSQIDPTFWAPGAVAVVAGAALLGAAFIPLGRGRVPTTAE
jgi:hypothetical protein